jgi:endonuclease YncB( thermonuclease family)
VRCIASAGRMAVGGSELGRGMGPGRPRPRAVVEPGLRNPTGPCEADVSPPRSIPLPRRAFELSSNHVYWAFVATLATSTVYFVTSVEQRRAALRADHAVEVDSGAEVRLVRVMDADEVSVHTVEGEAFVVRLLGIKGFSTTANEPGVSGLGQEATNALERALVDKQILLVYDELNLDSSGRVLAYLEVEAQDVGRLLVERGHVVTYTRYPFSRESVYQGAEAEARSERLGIWGNDKAVERVHGWQAAWHAAREAEGDAP